MPNPIFDSFNSPRPYNPQHLSPTQIPQSNNLLSMMQQVQSSKNPNLAMQTILSSNPQFQNVVNYINQNGGNARTAFYNMAAQKGIDPNSILNQLR